MPCVEMIEGKLLWNDHERFLLLGLLLERMRLFSRRYAQLADSMSAPLVRISAKYAANSARLICAPASRKSATQAPRLLSPQPAGNPSPYSAARSAPCHP